MCHSDHSRAPTPPVRGAVATHGPLRLRSADGAWFRAYQAVPAAPDRGSVVLLPDVRGLHPFYEDLARRFAEAGYTAAVIDLYGRTASDDTRGEDFAWRDHVPHVRDHQVDLDVQAAAAHLRAGGTGPLFTVGFCFGGGHSWRLAGSSLTLSGAIGFYGLPHLVGTPPRNASAPVLMLLAGDDDETPPAAYTDLTARLAAAGARFECHTYAGAPHSFFDRTCATWAEACNDAWSRILDFTRRHGRGTAAATPAAVP